MARTRPAVCHLTTVHDPFDQRVFEKECCTLARSGYSVSLIAQHPRDEEIRGVHILGLPSSPSRVQRMVGTTRALLARARSCNADIYHFHDPELLLAGWALAAEGRRVVYDVHEDVPRDLRSRHYLPRGVSHVIAVGVGAIEYLAARRFAAVVGATPYLAKRFERHAERTVVLRNYPPIADLAPPTDVPWSSRERAVAYAGGIDAGRGITPMVDAMRLVGSEVGATLHLAGRFSPPELRDAAAARPGWSHVVEHGFLDRRSIASLFARVRAGLVLAEPKPNTLHSISNKMFEYMAAGLPVIASDFPAWREVVESARCGIVVRSLDPAEIARAIRTVLDDQAEAEAMGRRGRAAVEASYNWEQESLALLDLYDRLLDRAG